MFSLSLVYEEMERGKEKGIEEEKKGIEEEKEETGRSHPTIEHLVIPGGFMTGIKALGALQTLEKAGFWSLQHIKSIYATSIGSMLAVLFALKYDWETITDYIVLRPWHDVFSITPAHLLDCFQKKGIFGKEIFETFFKPFFELAELPMDITMKAFYERTQIELHFFTVDMNDVKSVDMSYLTHPDLQVIQSVHMSSCLPMLFSPVFHEGRCYVDGGLVENYPVLPCLARFPDAAERILGINQIYVQEEEETKIGEENDMLDYVTFLISKMLEHVNTAKYSSGKIVHELSYRVEYIKFNQLKDDLCSSDLRRLMVEEGVMCAREYLESMRSS